MPFAPNFSWLASVPLEAISDDDIAITFFYPFRNIRYILESSRYARHLVRFALGDVRLKDYDRIRTIYETSPDGVVNVGIEFKAKPSISRAHRERVSGKRRFILWMDRYRYMSRQEMIQTFHPIFQSMAPFPMSPPLVHLFFGIPSSPFMLASAAA